MASELPEADGVQEAHGERARHDQDPVRSHSGPAEPIAPGGMPGGPDPLPEIPGLRGRVTRWIVEWLLQPIPGYERRSWNDPAALARHVRKGDVLLVEGDTRVAAIVKYLTQSCWSHAALYVGDELLRQGGETAERARALYGEGASRLMVEALPEGVVAAPLEKYVDYNVRLVRAHRLRPEHTSKIVAEAVASIGWKYDLRNILDLARYLIPVRLVPARYRRTALHFGSGMPTEVICSSLLGRLFQRVGFPIRPAVEFPEGFDTQRPLQRVGLRRRMLRRIFGHDSAAYTGIFRMRHPTLLTPADFDLSPYFEVVKFNVVADGGFDYQRINWAPEREEEPAPEPEHERPYGAEPPASAVAALSVEPEAPKPARAE